MRWMLSLVTVSMIAGCGGVNDAAKAPLACTGDVLISSITDWNAFVARKCASITGTLTLDGTDVASANFADLSAVGNLRVTNNAVLTTLGLPALTKINGDLLVDSNNSLRSVSIPLLTTISGDVWFAWALLNNLRLPVLTAVGGDLSVDSNIFLASLDLPALTIVSGTLGITNNRLLPNFNLPALTTVGVALNIWNDPALPQCLAIAFKDHLVAQYGFTGAWAITANDTTATCP